MKHQVLHSLQIIQKTCGGLQNLCRGCKVHLHRVKPPQRFHPLQSLQRLCNLLGGLQMLHDSGGITSVQVEATSTVCNLFRGNIRHGGCKRCSLHKGCIQSPQVCRVVWRSTKQTSSLSHVAYLPL